MHALSRCAPRSFSVNSARLLRVCSTRVCLKAIRFGDLAICGLPFEVLVEIGLELREKSPFGETMVIGLANGRYGYLPDPKQHALGGYETWLGTNTVEVDSSEILTKHLLEMLGELKGE